MLRPCFFVRRHVRRRRRRYRRQQQTNKNKTNKPDEVEYLITARNWDYLKGFLGVFATCEEDFVSLIDGMYPTEKPADVSARDSMQVPAVRPT